MRKLALSGSSVLIAVALLAACGGGSSKANPLSGGTTRAPSGGSSSSDFSKLVANANQQRFKITYTDSGGDSTVYEQDGKGSSVLSSGDTQTFTTKSGTVSCTKPSNGTVGCTQSPVSLATTGFGLLFVAEKNYVTALAGHFGDTSTKTIAGRSATCVTFSAKDIGGLGGAIAGAAGAQLKGSATYCNDKQTGVLLEISGTDDSGTATTPLVVTKYEEPSDADFTPPATPSTVPPITLPGGVSYTIPTIPGGG